MIAVVVVLVCDLIFGGATEPDTISSAIARIASLPLLAFAVSRLRWGALTAGARTGLLLLAAMVAIPVLQCIPLPPEVWERLPGRASIVADYLAVGIAPPWLPLSLSPYETAGAIFWFAPPATMFIAALGLPERSRVFVGLSVPVVAVIGVALGMLQVLGGPESSLRFYPVTNIESAVGFFANRNHQAAFLVVGLAMTPLAITIGSRETRSGLRAAALIAAGVEVILVVGIGVTRSRAGVLVGLPVLVLAPLIAMRMSRDRGVRRAASGLVIAALIGAALVGGFASAGLIERFETPMSSEARVQTVPAIRRAAALYFPAGSGLGSFDPVYRGVEPLGSVTSHYLNHAHDDALELLVEAGAPGIAVLVAFLVWWVWLTVAVWARRSSSGGSVAASASLAIAALLFHSLVDYPLRTTALASVFALACGLLAGGAGPSRVTVSQGLAERE